MRDSMENKYSNDATRLQIRRSIPAIDLTTLRAVRSQLCAGNALTIDSGFAISPLSAASANHWIMRLGEFDYALDLDNSQPIDPPAKDIHSRQPSLTNADRHINIEARSLEQSDLHAILNNCFLKPLTSPEMSRPYASAGSLYPVQVFILARQGRQWERFHLLPLARRLENLGPVPFTEIFNYVGCDGPVALEQVDLVLGFGIIPEISIAKYRLRGYKFSLIEIGEMIQEVTRNAGSMNFSTRPYGYFDELSIANLWGLNPDDIWIEQLQLLAKEDS